MSRYKYTKLKNFGPVHGFTIHTPDDRTLKDIYPQFIVRELNRLDDRIKRLEEDLGDAYAEMRKQYPAITAVYDRSVWAKANEDKP